MSDYLPYGKLNEGVQHVDIGVTVPLPETEVQGCSVHLDIWMIIIYVGKDQEATW